MRPRQRRTPLHLNQVAVSTGAYPTHTRRRRGKLSGLSRHLHLAFRGQRIASTTNDLVRRVVAANPSVRPVILAASHTPKDIMFALASGAFGFLCQNIPSKQLIKSLELVALGQTVIHPQFHQMAFAQMGVESHSTREFEATSASSGNNGYKAIAEPPRHSEVLSPAPSWPCPRPRRPELRMGARLATSSEACRAASW